MMENESQSVTDDVSLVVRVSTTDGFATNHTYHLRESASEQVDLIKQILRNALTGRTSLLALTNPDVIYRPEHIVRVGLRVSTSGESPGAPADRGPIGFRPT